MGGTKGLGRNYKYVRLFRRVLRWRLRPCPTRQPTPWYHCTAGIGKVLNSCRDAVGHPRGSDGLCHAVCCLPCGERQAASVPKASALTGSPASHGTPFPRCPHRGLVGQEAAPVPAWTCFREERRCVLPHGRAEPRSGWDGAAGQRGGDPGGAGTAAVPSAAPGAPLPGRRFTANGSFRC